MLAAYKRKREQNSLTCISHTEYPDLDEDELRLRGVAKDSQVAVTIEVDPTDERASTVARMGGFRSLKNVDLASLVELDDE